MNELARALKTLNERKGAICGPQDERIFQDEERFRLLLSGFDLDVDEVNRTADVAAEVFVQGVEITGDPILALKAMVPDLLIAGIVVERNRHG